MYADTSASVLAQQLCQPCSIFILFCRNFTSRAYIIFSKKTKTLNQIAVRHIVDNFKASFTAHESELN